MSDIMQNTRILRSLHAIAKQAIAGNTQAQQKIKKYLTVEVLYDTLDLLLYIIDTRLGGNPSVVRERTGD